MNRTQLKRKMKEAWLKSAIPPFSTIWLNGRINLLLAGLRPSYDQTVNEFADADLNAASVLSRYEEESGKQIRKINSGSYGAALQAASEGRKRR